MNARIDQILCRLEELALEKQVLDQELDDLRARQQQGLQVSSSRLNSDEKANLFLRLFRGRESVFPKLWENTAKGIKGYSPTCKNEWHPGVCEKPKVKCSDCPKQAFVPLNVQAVLEHLRGNHVIGTYAIRTDDSCIFLAADFDGDGYRDDVLAFKVAAKQLGIAVAIERSRSGNGAHAWIFFQEAISARLARQLGTIIVSQAITSRHTLRLETYDRFFPNQDFLPKGGFGNLIALPLQYKARQAGNTVFVNDDFMPLQDQWQFLAQVQKLSHHDVQSILDEHLAKAQAEAVENAAIEVAEQMLSSKSIRKETLNLPKQLEIEVGSQLSIKLDGLPSSMIAAFKKTATFANPKFFELERLRFSTWKTPRYIFCGEISDYLKLPRGCLEACLEICEKAGVAAVLKNIHPRQKRVNLAFNGRLSREQKRAVKGIGAHKVGVLVAPPGEGKTVMACMLIAKRKTPTLILVHRMPLLEQWRSRLTEFLGLEAEKIGIFAVQKRKQSGEIDIAMLQTLSKMENPEEVLALYGQAIVDECHHVPAVSFESVLKKCPAKYVLGLTATPYRKDGHQKILHMQCGPARFTMEPSADSVLEKRLVIRETTFRMPEDAGQRPPIHEVWEKLVAILVGCIL